MDKATQAGREDAAAWCNETPREQWEGAISGDGRERADAQLINGLGFVATARLLGVPAPSEDSGQPEFRAACRRYSEAWDKMIAWRIAHEGQTGPRRRRQVHSVQMDAAEWASVEAAARLEGAPAGAGSREATAAAWIRRVVLREAERARREGT